jgi:hypothetical protein
MYSLNFMHHFKEKIMIADEFRYFLACYLAVLYSRRIPITAGRILPAISKLQNSSEDAN